MPLENQFRSVVCFIADLLDASRVEAAATKLGYPIAWAGRVGELDHRLAATEPGSRQPAEHLTGQGAILIDVISAIRPALIIFDLGNAQIPWRDWLPLLKSVPATRRYPVVCYGSHVNGDVFQVAYHCGADAVYARSQFFQEVGAIIRQYARSQDDAAVQAACSEALSPTALEGLSLFNRGEYFEAHELLEQAWNEDQGAGRELYRAVLQVAVAYLQIERHNYRGAVKMFWRLRQWIEPLPDSCRGVNVACLREDARRAYDELIHLGQDGIASFDHSLLTPVKYTVDLL